MRQWDGPKRLRDRPGSILGSLRAPRGTPDADRDASNWSPNLVLGVSQGPDRSSSLSLVTRPLIFGAGRRARAGSERCFGNKTFGPAQKIFRTQNQNQTLTTSRPDLVRTLLLERNFRHSVVWALKTKTIRMLRRMLRTKLRIMLIALPSTCIL